jgi:hypothetical protein
VDAAAWPGSSQAVHTYHRQEKSSFITFYVSLTFGIKIITKYINLTNLRTDSTNTLRAFTWTQAQKHSLKFTFSHLTSGPYKQILIFNPSFSSYV